MRIGVFATCLMSFGGDGRKPTPDLLIHDAQAVLEDGLSGYWLPHQFDMDAMSVIAMLARAVPRIELVASVVPIHTRHPMLTGQQTVTAQMLSDGRFTLGLGVSHKISYEDRWGMPWGRPVATMREYLQVVLPLVRRGAVEHDGEIFRCTGSLHLVAPWPDTQVLVGALGPAMLRLAGRLADGTVTWMCGTAALRDHVVPTITAAAGEAGRQRPRIAACLPICVTDDEAGARARIAAAWAPFQYLPSYRAALERSGAADAGEIAIAGDPSRVREQIAEIAETGVTDLVAVPMGADDREREAIREALREAAARETAGRPA